MFFCDIMFLEKRIIMKKLKKMIPNILTLSRIIVTPLIIFLGIKGYYEALAIICVIVTLTDCFDGKLARRWGVCSEFGAKLDTIGDKLLAISLLSILVVNKKVFLYLLIVETLIALVNVIIYLKTKVTNSLLIGKIKTWILYITLIFGVINIFFSKIHIMMNIGIVLSLIFQILTLVSYIRDYYLLITKKKD